MRTQQLGHPTDHCLKNDFPTPLKKAPPAAVHLLLVIERIKQLTDEYGIRFVARKADLSSSTLSRTVSGEIWPSAISIASIEAAFEINLWK